MFANYRAIQLFLLHFLSILKYTGCVISSSGLLMRFTQPRTLLFELLSVCVSTLYMWSGSIVRLTTQVGFYCLLIDCRFSSPPQQKQSRQSPSVEHNGEAGTWKVRYQPISYAYISNFTFSPNQKGLQNMC